GEGAVQVGRIDCRSSMCRGIMIPLPHGRGASRGDAMHRSAALRTFILIGLVALAPALVVTIPAAPSADPPAGCTPLDLAAFGDPGPAAVTATLGTGGAVDCYSLHADAAGNVAIRTFDAQWIGYKLYNDAGTQICPAYNARSCVLPAA